MPTRYSVGPESTRLQHREFIESDAAEFFRLNSHPDVMKFTCDPPLSSLEEARRAILEYPDFQTVGFGRWACVLKHSDQLVGFCGLKFLPELDVVDLGYRFFPEFWGQGFATEAAHACLEFAFRTIQLPQVVAFVLPENVASIRVIQKIGMYRDGELIEDGLRAHRYVCDGRAHG